MLPTIYLNVIEHRKYIPIMSPDLALWLALISSDYPCLEHIFMVPKVFEPLKFYYTCIFNFRKYLAGHHNSTLNIDKQYSTSRQIKEYKYTYLFP